MRSDANKSCVDFGRGRNVTPALDHRRRACCAGNKNEEERGPPGGGGEIPAKNVQNKQTLQLAEWIPPSPFLDCPGGADVIGHCDCKYFPSRAQVSSAHLHGDGDGGHRKTATLLGKQTRSGKDNIAPKKYSKPLSLGASSDDRPSSFPLRFLVDFLSFLSVQGQKTETYPS